MEPFHELREMELEKMAERHGKEPCANNFGEILPRRMTKPVVKIQFSKNRRVLKSLYLSQDSTAVVIYLFLLAVFRKISWKFRSA